MDVISMQTANKVLRRMNTEFNGMYDIIIATDGQKTFTTSKQHDITNHGLHVYVNGYHAVEVQDYTHADQYNIEFKTGLRQGDIVLLSTQVVGVPKFEVTNPAYDDATIVAEIAAINNRITSIIQALDDDGDGSILDTIANIKQQWEEADSNIMLLIEKKAGVDALEALDTKVQELSKNMPTQFDPSEINKKIEANAAGILESSKKIEANASGILESNKKIEANAASILESNTKIEANTNGVLESNKKIEALEKKVLSSAPIIDEVTGRAHLLKLSNGVIGVKQAGTNLALSHNASPGLQVGESVEFELTLVANDDLGQNVKIVTENNDNLTLQMKVEQNWVAIEDVKIPSMTNTTISFKCSATEVKEHNVLFKVVRADNNYVLGEASMKITSTAPPSSKVSGTVTLNGADHSNVQIVLNTDSFNNTVAINELGVYSHSVTKAGEYTVRITNSNDTHKITSDETITLDITPGIDYPDNNFVLTAIVTPPEVDPINELAEIKRNRKVVR